MNSAINYLESVLGVKELMRAKTLFVSLIRPPRPSLLAKNGAADLFDKMLAAIGLSRTNIEILEVKEVTPLNLTQWEKEFSTVVVLDTPQANLNSDNGNILYTYHPEALLLNSAYKKAAWEQLKKLTTGGKCV